MCDLPIDVFLVTVLIQGHDSSRLEYCVAVFQSLRLVPARQLERSVRRGSLADDTKGDRRDKLHLY